MGNGETSLPTLFGDERELVGVWAKRVIQTARDGRMFAAPSKPIQREQWTLNMSLITKMKIF